MVFQRGFKAKANQISLSVRSQLGLGAIDPIDPWAICAHFDITVIKLSELSSNDGISAAAHFLSRAGRSVFSAVTMPVGCNRVIVHNDTHVLKRQRSNIAHELAHCFLGHPLTPPLLENGDRARHSGIEDEASFLGGALLVTNDAAKHIVLQKNDLIQAAEKYGVSRLMLNYRIRVSGANVIAARSATRLFGASSPG